jgi:CNT family concentrative nucleoside transporter
MIEGLISLLGLGFFVGISYLFSVNRKAVRWQPVLWGIALQLILALIILKTTPGLALFKWLGDVVSTFLNYSDTGAKFVFGDKIE